VRDSGASSSSASAGSYTVRDGDTLSSIAASQGTTWRALAQANGDVLTDPNMIFPGQTIATA
jgi:nucleoid-associated protein YgaU